MKRLVINKFYGWISNDPNISINNGSSYICDWLEVRENSKQITQSRWLTSTTFISTSSSEYVVWYNYASWSAYLRLHWTWKVTSPSDYGIDNWNYVVDLDWNGCNIWDLMTNNWQKGFIITTTKLFKWPYDSSNQCLWMYSIHWLVTTPNFASTTWWTVWAGWNIAGYQATHTAWTTNQLSQSTALTTTTGATYRFEVRCWTITAWTCVLALDWVTAYTFTTANSWKTVVFNYVAWWPTMSLVFTPVSAFAWSFINVEAYSYNVSSYTKTFNAKAPYIVINNFIYIWNWNKIVEVDTTTDTWILTDVLTIDLDFTIVWISKIWDQVFIYASNWATSKQYLWDWVNNYVERTITYIDKNIVNIANFWNQDYIITQTSSSKKSWLYVINGYWLQKLYLNTINSNPYLERIYFDVNYINAIETIWNRLVIPWLWWIYTYWNHTEGLPMALTKEYTYNWNWITAMSYNESNSNKLVYSYTSTQWWVTWIYEDLIQLWDSYNLDTNLSWFWELNYIWWDCISNIKDLEKITIWYKLKTSTQINIYSKNMDRTVKYASIPYLYVTLPVIGAIYTFNWNTYTIYAVTDIVALWWTTLKYCIIHCTYTWTWTWITWTFTKTNGTWDSTFYTQKVRTWYKYLDKITDTSKRRHTIVNAERFNELSIAYQLITWLTTATAWLNDINIYYKETNDD